LGAAYLAGLQGGVYQSLEELGELWGCEQGFEPSLSEEQLARLYKGWLQAVKRVMSDAV
jgi:glycerol kinase